MKKSFKLFYIFSVIILLFMLTTTYSEYKKMVEMKHLIATEEMTALSKFIISFRKVYLDNFANHKIEVTDKIINLLPAVTLSSIGREFEELLDGDVSLRTVSNRPRNPINKANDYENNIIKYFEKNKKLDFLTTHNEDIEYSYFVPLYIEKSCLKCHGKREDAIESIRNRYDKGYDYKLGDLRGLLHIEISNKNVFNKMDESFIKTIFIKICAFILIIILLYYLVNKIQKYEIKYTHELEDKVSYQVNEIRTKDKILDSQSKKAAMGEMIENIAHQWRQPLSVISVASSGIKFKNELKVLKEEDINAAMVQINNSVKHLSRTIDDFRNFFKNNKKKLEFKLNDTFKKTFNLITVQFNTANITIIKNIEDVSFVGFENELIQVLINILNNARDELIKKEQNIERLIIIDVVKKHTQIEICIKDNAGGIPKDIINNIFEPHFTTKEETDGTGVGLYMSQRIIKEHMNGILEVSNTDFVYNTTSYIGAEFKISLPLKI